MISVFVLHTYLCVLLCLLSSRFGLCGLSFGFFGAKQDRTICGDSDVLRQCICVLSRGDCYRASILLSGAYVQGLMKKLPPYLTRILVLYVHACVKPTGTILLPKTHVSGTVIVSFKISIAFTSARGWVFGMLYACSALCLCCDLAPLPRGDRERHGLEEDSHGPIALRRCGVRQD